LPALRHRLPRDFPDSTTIVTGFAILTAISRQTAGVRAPGTGRGVPLDGAAAGEAPIYIGRAIRPTVRVIASERVAPRRERSRPRADGTAARQGAAMISHAD